ncbi:alpha/beta hydrolase [Undibacter mobilis]|uniref:Alpha/beta hydrolase n=1 Tax=Undibacter mobilis TaxID=2292256 RepID=A0A371B3W5_9BRAD|nr:alpha/beta hydrolase [Undibacter mobilis]RDV02278.1 alpha/beta hydrolase [Undibacter mobilis]
MHSIREPLSPYGAGTYNSLITVVQAVPLAAFLWVMVDNSRGGDSLVETFSKALSTLDWSIVPVNSLVKIVISILGIMTIWHAYATNDQFHAYRQKFLDTAIPFLFGLFETCVVLTIPSERMAWTSFWLMMTMILGMVAIWNMKFQTQNQRALQVFEDHFESDAVRVYEAVIEYCSASISILWRYAKYMFIAVLVSLPIGILQSVHRHYIDTIFIVVVYLCSIVELKINDIESFLSCIDDDDDGGGAVLQTVDVDGKSVEVVSRSYGRDSLEGGAIFFLPGWSAGGAHSLVRFCGHLASAADTRVVSLETKPVAGEKNSILIESMAAVNYIGGVKPCVVTLIGHSEGAIKVSHAIRCLKERSPKTKINAVILISPVGLFEHAPSALISRFLRDATFGTLILILRNFQVVGDLAVRASGAALDVVAHVASDVRRLRIGYVKSLLWRIGELSKIDPAWGDVDCPVILIAGRGDRVAFPVDMSGGGGRAASVRRSTLLDGRFVKASSVQIFMPFRYGVHGLIHFRAEQIARVCAYLVRRRLRHDARVGPGHLTPPPLPPEADNPRTAS